MTSTCISSKIEETDHSKVLHKIITSTLIALTESSLEMADIYVKHACRSVITEIDITLAIRFQSKHFIDSEDFEDKIKSFMEDSDEDSDEDSEEDSDEDSSEDTKDIDESNKIFTKSKCTCKICEDMNNVNNWWSTWQPIDPLKLSLKKAINNAVCDNMIDI
tara:strand:- start:157 stop:642 length:486 start_codon:yes stop_codon:yes gene_type:complete